MLVFVDILEKLQNAVPVKWDQFFDSTNGYWSAFGWITRPDGQRDYVAVDWWESELPDAVCYSTSSPTYCPAIRRVLYGYADDQPGPRPVDELFARAATRRAELQASQSKDYALRY